MNERTVIGRPLGTTEWTSLEEYRDYNSKELKGYFVNGDRHRFYLPDQVELRKYIDLSHLKLEIAKNCLYNILRHEGCADERNVDDFTKKNQVKDAWLYANLFMEQLKEEKI